MSQLTVLAARSVDAGKGGIMQEDYLKNLSPQQLGERCST